MCILQTDEKLMKNWSSQKKSEFEFQKNGAQKSGPVFAWCLTGRRFLLSFLGWCLGGLGGARRGSGVG